MSGIRDNKTFNKIIKITKAAEAAGNGYWMGKSDASHLSLRASRGDTDVCSVPFYFLHIAYAFAKPAKGSDTHNFESVVVPLYIKLW